MSRHHRRYHAPGTSQLGHKYAYRPPPADHPFVKAMAGAPMPKSAAPVPATFDLRSYQMAPRDQLQLGCCTGFASAGFREGLHAAKTEEAMPGYLSPAFLYAKTRMKEGTFPRDSGASIADEMWSLTQFGVCPESFLPYTGIASEAPTPSCDVAATPYRISNPVPVDCTDVNGIKSVLANKQPIVIAFTVYQSFETPDANGVVPLPDPTENTMGGHGVLVVGYNEVGWIIRNSWGTNWGIHGYCIQPYDYEGNWFEAWTAEVQ